MQQAAGVYGTRHAEAAFGGRRRLVAAASQQAQAALDQPPQGLPEAEAQRAAGAVPTCASTPQAIPMAARAERVDGVEAHPHGAEHGGGRAAGRKTRSRAAVAQLRPSTLQSRVTFPAHSPRESRVSDF